MTVGELARSPDQLCSLPERGVEVGNQPNQSRLRGSWSFVPAASCDGFASERHDQHQWQRREARAR